MDANGALTTLAGWFKLGEHDPEISKDTAIDDVRFVVLDTELTSLDRRSNRLLSVGALVVTGTKIHVGETFYRVVNPGVTVPAQSVVIHKLRPEDVAQGQSPEVVIGELNEFFGTSLLMGHFAEIDRDVLRKEFASVGRKLENSMICTARIQQWIVQKRAYKEDKFRDMERLDLASLAAIYGLEHHEAHHALDDAFMTARLWQRQKHELEQLGVKTLGQLLRIAKV